MNPRIARLLSIVLHPVLFPTYAIFFIFEDRTFLAFTTPPSEKYALYTIIILNTLLLPLLISYMLVNRGMIRSFEMEKREERIVPFLSNAFLLVVSYYLMRRFALPIVFQLLILGAAASVVLTVIINFKWKISIHMVGIGGVIGAFFGLSTFLLVDLRIPILFCLLIAGLLGSARLTVGSHSPMQIYAGFVVGFFCEYLILSL